MRGERLCGDGRPPPPRDCPKCPRLGAYRAALRNDEPLWFNAPVPSFGDPGARLLVVGLAPGKSGANRTGRPFTGDFAGKILYHGLLSKGFARGVFDARPDDGFKLVDCRVTNAVRCVPPENKPTGAEATACRDFLLPELTDEPVPEVVLALGRIAHDAVLRALGLRVAAFPFRHGGIHTLEDSLTLVSTYHTSRYNVNTGRLTPEMFDTVLDTVRSALLASER